MSKKMSESAAVRVFEGTQKGNPFSVSTALTDEQAVALLRDGTGVGFANDCADQIELAAFAKNRKGIRVKQNLVAWGFRMAQEKIDRPACVLHASYRKQVAFRKPFKGTVAGERVAISLCGDNSAHAGKYRISNDEPFGSPTNKFYGFASPDGAWSVTRACPPTLMEALMNGK